MRLSRLLADLPRKAPRERIESLLERKGVRLERIVSTGQASPHGFWYDQDEDEWVVLLAGAAAIRFEDEPAERALRPGDALFIPAHRRHRVAWTDPERPTVWLAIYLQP